VCTKTLNFTKNLYLIMTETLKLGSYRLEMILKAPAYLFGNVK